MIIHLNPDASPQGLEAFLCKEFVTRGGDVRNAETSIMPYTSLSHKHMGVIDKGMCIMHMVFLRVGPRQVHMQLYGARTRQVLSDFRSELRLGDIVDMSGPYLRGGADISVDLEELKGTFFFPMAITAPVPAHLNDWILYMTLVRLVFWKYYEKTAKCISRVLRNETYFETIIS